MLVVDASAFVHSLLTGTGLPDDDTWHSPAGVDLEVVSAWRRLSQHGLVRASDAREGIERFVQFDIRRHDATRLLPRIWSLRHDIGAYDAAYVALAEALGAPLLTLDRRLARTARRYCTVMDA